MRILFIDESGKNHLIKLDPKRPHFTLAGLIIKDTDRQECKVKADQIKFKYWGRTDVVFHAFDMKWLKGDFAIFKPTSGKFTIQEFQQDLENYFNQMDINLSLQSLNKSSYVDSNPPIKYAIQNCAQTNFMRSVRGVERKLVKDNTKELLVSFLDLLMNLNETGRVVIEATGDVQDLFMFESYNELLSNGYTPFNMKGADIRKYFTSLSLVTKNNHDTESQIVDMVAYYMTDEMRSLDNISKISTGSFTERVINIFKQKTFEYKNELAFGKLKNSFNKVN